jgi:hypothetical protein
MHALRQTIRQREGLATNLWLPPACISWSWALESVFRSSNIHSLKAQVELRLLCCASLHTQFKTESLTKEQKSEITGRWVESFRESQALLQMVVLMEREEHDNPGYTIPNE